MLGRNQPPNQASDQPPDNQPPDNQPSDRRPDDPPSDQSPRQLTVRQAVPLLSEFPVTHPGSVTPTPRPGLTAAAPSSAPPKR